MTRRIIAALLGSTLALAALAQPASAGPPRPAQPRTTTLSGCVTTITDTDPHFGWFWRTTQTVCLDLHQQQSDCLTVENMSTAGAPTVVLLPRTCRYSRLR